MKITFKKTDHVGLDVDNHAMKVMSMTPTYPKGAPRSKKRLIRIRLNLIRELRAFNKEIRRHSCASQKT